MKAFALLIVVTLSFISCRRELVIDEEKLPHAIFYPKGSHKPFSGTCKIMFRSSNKVKAVFHYQKGYLNGNSTGYFLNGKISWQGTYAQNRMNGTWKRWDEEGNLLYDAHYVNDTLK